MQLDIRRILTFIDHKMFEVGKHHEAPLRRVAAVAIVGNPYANRYVADLSELIGASVGVGQTLAGVAVEAMGTYKVESYGKGGVVGLSGELEHANAMLTTSFAGPLRDAVGGALAFGVPHLVQRTAVPGCRSIRP
jgi:hypothetical protein